MSSQLLSELKNRLDDAISFSITLPSIPTGFFLTSDQILLLTPELSVENKLENSIGRYRKIPVYDISFRELAEDECQCLHHGIAFKYVSVLAIFH